jgi:hypothetical protein
MGANCPPRSRAVWKHVRDAEAGLVPRRTIQQNFKNEISRIRASQASSARTGNLDAKLQQLEEQLKKAESDDAPLERELDLLKRAAIKESEAVKWKAFRDVSENCPAFAASQTDFTSMAISSFSSQVRQSSCSMFSHPLLGRTVASSRRPLSAPLSSVRWIADTHHRRNTSLSTLVPFLRTIGRALARRMPTNLARSPLLPIPAITTPSLVRKLPNRLAPLTLMHTP